VRASHHFYLDLDGVLDCLIFTNCYQILPIKINMKTRSLTLAAWIGILSILPIPGIYITAAPRVAAQQSRTQLPQAQIERIARSITVKILSGDNSGSGVAIKKEGRVYTVLTNHHVLESGKPVLIQTPDGKTHAANLVKGVKFGANDLALLQFSADGNYTVASLANSSTLKIGDEVFAAGFPFEADSSASGGFAFKNGRISLLLERSLKGGYQIGYTNEIEKGMSGGPIINSEGKVIGLNGIHGQPLWGDPYVYEDGSKPNDELANQMRRSSWGVPIEALATLAPQFVPAGIAPPTSTTNRPSTQPLTQLASKVDNIAKEITVLITWSTSNGSGVIIAKEGNTYYVLTARHVAKGNRDLTLVAPDGKQYPVDQSAIKTWEGLDLAILQFKSDRTYQVATLGNYDSGSGDRLAFVSGWPEKPKPATPTRRFSAGFLLDASSSINLARDDRSLSSGYGLVYTNITERGMSGGPVLDVEGRLIGIHTAAEADQGNQSPVLERSDRQPKLELGYSLGIPIRRFLALLESDNVKLNLKQQTSLPRQLTAPEQDETLRASLDLTPPERNANEIDWLNYGNKLWRSRRYEEARQAFAKATAIKPDFYEAWYADGMALMRQQKYPAAIKSFNTALKYNPKSDRALRQLSDAFFYSGDYESGRQTLEKAIQLRPDDFILYEWLSETLIELGRYPESLKAINKAIALNPHPWGYIRRANTYRQINDYDAAIADLTKAIELQPDNAFAYRRRGYYRSEQANFAKEQSLADLTKAIELQPNDASNYVDRGIVYAKIKDRQKFTADFNKALALKPDDPWIYENRAYARHLLGDYQGAVADYTEAIRLAPELAYQFYTSRAGVHPSNQKQIEDYTEAIRLKPNYVSAYVRRGSTYASIGDSQKFIQDFNEAIRLQPDNAWIYTERGAVYFVLGEKEQGIKDYERAIALNRELAYQYYNQRGVALYKQQDYQGAITDFSQAIKLQPQNVQFYLNRGDAYAKLKDKLKALQDLNEALRLQPNNPSIYISRGSAYFALGEKEQGRKDYARAISLAPESAYVYYKNRGLLYYEQKDYQAAIADYTESLRLQSDYAIAYLERGKTYYELKAYQKAIADYDRVIAIAPDAAVAYGARGLASYWLGEYQKAVDDLTKAIDLKVKMPDLADAYVYRAVAYSKLQNYEAAIADITESIRLIPNHPQNHTNYGIRGSIYEGMKKYQEALADYAEAIHLNPKSIIIYEYRAALRQKLGDKRGAREDWEKIAQLYLEKGDKDNYQIAQNKLRELQE
jgi:tetratricopeptide (TPR) repeat protein